MRKRDGYGFLVKVHNSLDRAVDSRVELSVAPAPTGSTTDVSVLTPKLAARSNRSSMRNWLSRTTSCGN